MSGEGAEGGDGEGEPQADSVPSAQRPTRGSIPYTVSGTLNHLSRPGAPSALLGQALTFPI